MKITREMAEAAANWWANRLQYPSYNNGDDSGMAGMLASMVASKEPAITEEQLSAFKSRLIESVLSAEWCNSLYTDYGPDQLLEDAARIANIPRSLFSWKSGVWFGSDGTVRAASGYGVERKQIYPIV